MSISKNNFLYVFFLEILFDNVKIYLRYLKGNFYMSTNQFVGLADSAPLDECKIIKKLSCVSIAGNVILTVFKLFAGIWGNSGALISDAIHSLSDVFTTIIAWIGVKIAKQAADEKHQYGHERHECVASFILGLILLVTGLGIGKVGIENIIDKTYLEADIPSRIALVAAFVSILGKEAMYWYTRYYAKIINSQAFMADAWHHRADAISSVGALIGVAGAMCGFPVMDLLASLFICLFILKVSYDIIGDALSKLLDTSCGLDYEKKLHDFIAGQDNVKSVDMLQSRMFGNKVYVDLEISVDGEISLREAHDIAEHVHNEVEHNFPEIKHIMIHVNPV